MWNISTRGPLGVTGHNFSLISEMFWERNNICSNFRSSLSEEESTPLKTTKRVSKISKITCNICLNKSKSGVVLCHKQENATKPHHYVKVTAEVQNDSGLCEKQISFFNDTLEQIHFISLPHNKSQGSLWSNMEATIQFVFFNDCN